MDEMMTRPHNKIASVAPTAREEGRRRVPLSLRRFFSSLNSGVSLVQTNSGVSTIGKSRSTMVEGLLDAHNTGRGRAGRFRALATASIPPLAVGATLGITYGNIGGCLEEPAFMERYNHPSSVTLQLLAAAMQLGCVLGSLFASWSSDHFGRRPTTLVAIAAVALASAVLAFPAIVQSSTSLLPLFFGRFLSGMGGGLACAVVPLHVSEVAPASHRGGIEASYQLAIECGILFAYVLNYAVTGTHYGWMLSLTASLPPSLCFLLWAGLYLPESPRFLVERGREVEAARVLGTLRTVNDDVAAEVAAIRLDVCDPSRAKRVGWVELCRGAARRKRVTVALLVLALQVGTGIDFVTVYAPRIFSQIANSTAPGSSAADLGGGLPVLDAGAAARVAVDVAATSAAAASTPFVGNGPELLYTIYVGLTFVVVTPFAIYAVDRCGRRALLLLGSAGMTLSLGGLAIAYPHLSSAASLRVLCVSCVLSYVACFSFSWGPVAWVLPSEMISYQLRAKVVAAGTVLNWAVDWLVVVSFLSLTRAFGDSGAFALYAIVNAAALLFVLLCVPESKGLTIEEASGDGVAGSQSEHPAHGQSNGHDLRYPTANSSNHERT